ncbi:MAG: NlpC/P60 family protein [Oscillospiraceae bacterium]|nr:NlpC/P60 family protein [Oscillospiraceae bacterium]
MNRKSRIIASLLAFTLYANSSAVYATGVDELKNQVEVNQTELDNVMKELGKLESELQKTNNDIEVAMSNVQATDNEIAKVKMDIEKTSNDLTIAKQDKADKEKEYGDRLVEIYKKGKFDYLSYILASNDIENIVTRFELAQKAFEYDQSVIAEMQSKQDAIDNKLSELNSQNESLNTLLDSRQKVLDDLNSLKADEETKRDALNVKKDQHKNEIAQLQKQIDDLMSQIVQPVVTNNNNVASNNVASVPAQQQVNVNRGDTGGSSDIVNYAAQFLGVPYVWGGTSPAGFDCSGFAQYVYLHAAGISLPRIAADQQNAGYAVSTPERGDLVFFGYPAYHVAIYVGNGTIIQAPSSGDVVKYTPLAYMSDYAGARRYR